MPGESIFLDRPVRDIWLVPSGSAQARADARERHAAEVAAARENGYGEGRNDAGAALEEQLMRQRQEVLALADGVLLRLSEQHAALAKQARACVPGLVMKIVRRVLAGCEPTAERVQHVVERTLAETPSASEETLEVLLCPSDLALLETMGLASVQEKHPRVVIRAEPALMPNDCQVRGSFGLIDGRMETQLAAIEELLIGS